MSGVTDDSSGSPVVLSRKRESVGCQMIRPIIERTKACWSEEWRRFEASLYSPLNS